MNRYGTFGFPAGYRPVRPSAFAGCLAAISLALLAPDSLGQQNQTPNAIKVHGQVYKSGAKMAPLPDAEVNLWISGASPENAGERFLAGLSHDRDRTRYEKILSPRYQDKWVRILASAEGGKLVLPKTIAFKTDQIRGYEFDIGLKYVSDIALGSSQEASQLLATIKADGASAAQEDAKRVLDLFAVATQLYPHTEFFRKRVQAIVRIEDLGVELPEYVIDNALGLQRDAQFSSLPEKERAKVYEEMAEGLVAIARRIRDAQREAEEKVRRGQAPAKEMPKPDKARFERLSRHALKAFDALIQARPGDSEGYHGRAMLLSWDGLNIDAATTLKQFFEINPQIKSEKIFKTMMAFWIAEIEHATAFPRTTVEEYVSDMRQNPDDLAHWRTIGETLARHERLFRVGTSTESKKFREVLARVAVITRVN